MDSFRSQLLAFRAQIDQIDDQLMELLVQRAAIVSEVGALKKHHLQDECYIRSGREGDMVRRIYTFFKDKPLSAEAMAGIWRLLIAASTAIEENLTIATLSDDQSSSYWLSREYFGNFLPIQTHRTTSRVIGDLMEGKASIGVLPLPSIADSESWWPLLFTDKARSLRIFALLPFIQHENARLTQAVAIARLEPEASAQDVSYFALEVDESVSTSRLQSAFQRAQLEATWVNILQHPGGKRAVLVAINGFLKPDGLPIEAVRQSLDSSLLRLEWLGAHPAPIMVPDSKPLLAKAPLDVSKTAAT